MFWTIYHRNGVELAEAADRTSALNWCEKRLGQALAPFALIPATEEDLQEVDPPLPIGQDDVEIARSIYEATLH